MEALKRVEMVEEELAGHRIENSRLVLTNQRLQEEVSKVVFSLKLMGSNLIRNYDPLNNNSGAKCQIF